MAAQLRELRSRIKATKSIGKITKAMELIATARITKARARVAASRPYADEITKVLSALAGAATTLDHPMLVERPNPKRAAVLVVTSDKGQCGGYNSNVLRATEELLALLRKEGKEPQVYVTGNKGLNYYRFRNRDVVNGWTGFSDQPGYTDAVAAGDALVESFMLGADDADGNADGITGVDEIHVVYTEFVSMLTQRPVAKRVAPLEVEYSEGEEEKPAGLLPSYEFEPSADKLLDSLLPKYINTRLYAALLESAASELAARRTAMKAASDNANELVGNLTREMNQARQAQITQEISEIVGGANALTAAGSDD
ncbi:F0F1 ATP synthase subunit gamma [Amycolatopsis sp. SID8362]|uniref:F0F1 ATP synthase subunit gamma n=1 Tax=Amycolatopsis sp. SID8362 TaxID=2690346 RepID=UPI00136D81EF|nr:F0F1 ATP synthase subunit gamma [Amycolatopsis sp. SID8362]NBH04587.1 F0F1 ATP synthase subunit gamma [Amycolatopsis sp. SID8362]NED41286.1 F0F1 ATP synthase subunit gamma [Amycolatopsis sp. SID8362]